MGHSSLTLSFGVVLITDGQEMHAKMPTPLSKRSFSDIYIVLYYIHRTYDQRIEVPIRKTLQINKQSGKRLPYIENI